MTKEKLSFWNRIFRISYRSVREEKVLGYIIHRKGDGVPLKEVTQEEYVRRNASPDEVQEILENPKLVEAVRKKMEKDLSSGA